MNGFDISQLGEYRAHHQLEAKKAKGGFPNSFWETYSAFANTDGGIILLGVGEMPDGKLVPEGVDASKLMKDFWNMVNNRQKISANIVTGSMVIIEELNGQQILVVQVPRAERTARPVYVGMDPRSGTYRRNHEGDYHCSIDEMSLMFRDASFTTQDAKVLEYMDLAAFCPNTIKGYRNFFRSTHSNHLWNNDDDEMFLRKIGAISIGSDGQFHPTAAGLLMFGYEYEITREFPNYFLDYQENRSLGLTRWTDRQVSTSGDWSGNVFDFVISVLRKMQQDLKVPFVLKGNLRVDDTPIHRLLREAITNSVVHADFYGRQGLVIQKSAEGYKLTNPGTVRISIPDAIYGGISDPRNGIMLKMFSLIDFGERAGSGLSGIYKVWEKVYHMPAFIEETHKNGVDRTSLTLPISHNGQDINAMLELYDNTCSLVESQSDQKTPESEQKNPKSVQKAPESDQKNPVSEQKNPESDQKTPVSEQKTPQSEQKTPQSEQKTPQSEQKTPQSEQKTPQSEQNAPTSEEIINSTSNADRKDLIQKIINILAKNPKKTISELAIELDISPSRIKRILKLLKCSNQIRRIGSDRKGYWEIISHND